MKIIQEIVYGTCLAYIFFKWYRKERRTEDPYPDGYLNANDTEDQNRPAGLNQAKNYLKQPERRLFSRSSQAASRMDGIYMQLLPLICTLLIVASATVLAFGWYHIRKGNQQTHQRLMIVSSILALLFFILYIGRTLFVGNTSYGGPESLSLAYHLFLFFSYYVGHTCRCVRISHFDVGV